MRKSYIEKAQEVYENIINKDILVYRFFIKSVLKEFKINKISQLEILSYFLNQNEAQSLNVKFNENGMYRVKCGDREIRYDYKFKDDQGNLETQFSYELDEYDIDLRNHALYESYYMKDCPGFYSLCATIKLWEIIEKKYKIHMSSQSLDPSLTNEILKRSFDEYCVRVLKKNNIEDLYAYCDANTLKFFVYLWKSIVVGEFYRIPNYEKKLDTLKYEIEDRYLPAFITYYSEISSSFSTFLNRINPLNWSDKYLQYKHDVNPTTIAKKVVDSYSERFIKTKMLKPLIELTELLFEVTFIDLNYKVSDNNIAKLTDFISSLNTFNTETFNPNRNTSAQRASILLKHIDEEAFNIFANVREILLAKSSILLNQIIDQTQISLLKINQKVPSLCGSYMLANDKLSDIISKFKCNQLDNDPFYALYCNNKNKEMNISSYNDYVSNIIYEDSTWRKIYNENIYKAITHRVNNSKLHCLISSNDEKTLKNIENFIERHKDNSDNHEYKYNSPSTYINSIIWLHKHIANNGANKYKEVMLFGDLLKYFRRYINTYKNIYCVPQTYRSYFENSFCELNKNLLIKTHLNLTNDNGSPCNEDVIFFASIGYQPFNIEYLESFFYYYNLELKTFERKSIELSIKESHNATQKSQEVTKKIEDEQSKTLQLLGLLGVFIAFITSVVNTQIVATDIFKFILFSTTFLTGILIFIFGISCIAKTTSEWTRFHSNNLILIVILIITTIVMSLFVMN